jgi:AraC family transcriptional regulator
VETKSTKIRVEAKSRRTNVHRREYGRRVSRVIDHIRANLAKDLTLERLADIAAFSPFHFHRIFIAVTGETLNDFVRRVRLERAASALLLRGDMNVIDVALNYGFSSPAAFARAFKAHFGMSASQWRSGGAGKWSAALLKNRNPGKADRKVGKAGGGGSWHRSSPMTGAIAMQVTVQELPTFRVAYMRNVGPYGAQLIPGLWKRLHQWMAPRGLEGEQAITLGVAYDDPRVVAPEKCRYDACVVVPEAFRDDSIDFKHIAGGRYAVTPFVGTADEINAMWDRFYREWLPTSGFQPADRPCFDFQRGDARVPGDPMRFRCELCLPIHPL